MANDFDQFWNMYGGRDAKLCEGTKNKGPKGKALESWKKNVENVVEPEKVLLALEAQVRFDKAAKAAGKWVSRWPMAVTWLNQNRWDCEIESHEQLQTQTREAKQCEMEGCNEPVLGPRYKLCSTHLTRSTPVWEQDKQLMAEFLGREVQREDGESWGSASRRWWQERGREMIARRLIGRRTRGSRGL